MDYQILILLFLGGCLGGLLAGLLGIGGGLVFVLIFTNYLTALQIPDIAIAQLIIANSMFAIFFAGVSGSIKHYLNGDFYLKPTLVTGIMASVCSIGMTYFINHTRWYNKQVFTVIFIFIVIYIAYSILFNKKEETAVKSPEEFSVKKFFIIGGAGGILASLSGIGGGTVMVPMLTKMLNIGIKKATAISLGAITITSLLLTAYTFLITPKIPVSVPHSYGLIILPMVLPVSLGCLLCSPFGVGLAKKLSQKAIQVIFACFLILVTFNMIFNLWH